ncbi:conserved hypothetical protein [Frankia canadensis]|uniref:SnoaL-like domain-containing protein n=1 Tax=Frankia canadensis TaxID=1836972 RepID=A0A2I2KUF5_9ACTN|nr:conserved hypothetical protein [Frankia canadensis]SOU56572.1 conserved hypothetical protein [Frankia canadensis]
MVASAGPGAEFELDFVGDSFVGDSGERRRELLLLCWDALFERVGAVPPTITASGIGPYRPPAVRGNQANHKMINSQVSSPAQQLVMRYFEMWNGGDSAIAFDILHQEWIDHAHPEVTGPAGVQRAVERIRTAQPDLRFNIQALLGDGNLVAAVGEAASTPGPATAASRLIWLVRIQDGRMAEMWTYHNAAS